MLPDLRYALRLFRRSPAFTAVAILSLAFGIGANTAIYSLFYTVMLRPLPVSHPEQLVEFLRNTPEDLRSDGYWGWDRYAHIRDHNHVFSALTATSFDNLAFIRSARSDPETLVLENVAGNYFQFLGLTPALGRFITPADVPAEGEGGVAVISWRYWNTRLHGVPDILGQTIYYEDAPKTIIGVAPRTYTGTRVGVETDVWQPVEHHDVTPIARLKPGVSLAQAQAEVNVLYRATPRSSRTKVELEPAATGLVRVRDRYGRALTLLLAIVGLLLLLACINLAGMLLARSAARRRELAVRISLGAGRARLARQMLTESLLLSAAGALAGIAVAYLATTSLVHIMSTGRAFEHVDIQVHPDLHLLLFTAAIALFTGLLFGLAPALHAFRASPDTEMRQTRFRPRIGQTLVAVQVALSLLLVTAAAVFLSHLTRLRHFDLGFRSDHVLLVTLDPSRAGYRRDQLAAPYQEILDRLNRLPGVRSASLSGCTPLQGCGSGGTLLTAEGHPEPPTGRVRVNMTFVAPRYFDTIGIRLIAGRDFNFRDTSRPRVAIVNQTMARRFFPNENPIGRRVTLDSTIHLPSEVGVLVAGAPSAPYEIIAVAADAKAVELRDPPYPTIYFDMFQENRFLHQFELRTTTNPESLTPLVRQIVRDVLKTVPISRVSTLGAQVDSNIVPERLIATLSEYFAALAAVLAGVGVYGLLAYTVACRTAEIGIRMALGATPASVRRLILRDTIAIVGAGLSAGVWLIRAARPLAVSLFHDLRWEIATPIAVASTAIVAIAILASLVPARRAARVDPMQALRHE